jgi:group I intron endonuclease
MSAVVRYTIDMENDINLNLNESWVIYGLKKLGTDEYRYIGMTTKKLSRRIYLHTWESKKASPVLPVHKWIKSIEGAFEVDILAKAPKKDKDELAKLEISYISWAKENDYKLLNLTNGGEGTLGYSESEEVRKKKSKQMSGEGNPRYGIRWTPELRAKILAALPDQSGGNNPRYGVTLSEETRQKISENHADVSGENNPFYNKTHSEETRKKMSDSWASRDKEKALEKRRATIANRTEEEKLRIREIHSKAAKLRLEKRGNSLTEAARQAYQNSTEAERLARQLKRSQTINKRKGK